jgi:TonB family protein
MRKLLLALPLVLTAIGAPAQSQPDALKARLLDQPLYLRGLWRSDRLSFDATGQLQGPADSTSFTLAGIDILAIDLHGNKLVLEGRRVALKFDHDTPVRIPMNVGEPKHPRDERIHIEIAAPASHDYTQALDAIVTPYLGVLTSNLPPFWQPYARKHFPLPEGTAPAAALPPSEQALPYPFRRDHGSNMTPPRVVYQPEPEFSEAARALKVSGNSMIRVVVDPDGNPTRIAVVRPIGLGLDEKALEAVQAYRFRPATRDGQPVAVEINIEVNFQIF